MIAGGDAPGDGQRGTGTDPASNPGALRRELERRVDGEIRFDAGSRGPTRPTAPTTGRCPSASPARARWTRAPKRLPSAPGTAYRCCRGAAGPALVGRLAALLMPAIRGGLGARDPRTVRTLDAYRAELTHDHYAYRFRHDERPLAEAEGAFLLCGHLMALAEHQQGHEREAVRWFERTRAACGPPGLFTEEYDIGQRQLRGNLP